MDEEEEDQFPSNVWSLIVSVDEETKSIKVDMGAFSVFEALGVLDAAQECIRVSLTEDIEITWESD